MTNVTQLPTRKYIRKVRIARITAHAMPLPRVLGFAVFSVGVGADDRATDGGVHSRHLLSTSMDDTELFTYAALYLTSENGAPVHAPLNGRFGELGDTIDTLAEELAKLNGGADAEGYYYTQMAAANIALACLNAVSKATRVSMLTAYLQTTVGLFETEGAVTTFWKCVDRETPTYEVEHCSSATHTPEHVCRMAFEMLFTRISDGRIPPNLAVDEALRVRRARSLASEFASVQPQAVSQFLATINDRAPVFWIECGIQDEDDVLELEALEGNCIRVME